MRAYGFSKSALLLFTLATPSFLFADYTYQQTTQLTGGSMLSMMKMAGAFSSQARKVGDPVVSTIYLKDNRMARSLLTPSRSSISTRKPSPRSITSSATYTVVTFRANEATDRERAPGNGETAGRTPGRRATASNPNPDDDQISFDVKVRKTGQEKQISGLDSERSHPDHDHERHRSEDAAIRRHGHHQRYVDGSGNPGLRPGARHSEALCGEDGPRCSAGVGLDMSRMLAQNPGARPGPGRHGKRNAKARRRAGPCRSCAWAPRPMDSLARGFGSAVAAGLSRRPCPARARLPNRAWRPW